MYTYDVKETWKNLQSTGEKIKSSLTIQDNYCTTTDIEKLLECCENITRFCLRSQLISTLPDLSAMSSLRYLELEMTSMKELQRECLPDSLEEIILRASLLSRLTDAIWQMPRLNMVNISYCISFKQLNITEGSTIKQLYLSLANLAECKLQGVFPHLTTLQISSDVLEYVEMDTQGMQQLTNLNIRAKLKDYHIDFSQLSALTSFSASSWQITDYSFLNQLVQLEWLSVCAYQPFYWSGFPDLNQLQQLKRIDLQYCGDTVVESLRQDHPSLVDLTISHSKLENLEQVVKCFPHLKYLNLYQCTPVNLGEMLLYLNKLENLSIRETPIVNLPKSLETNPILKKLVLIHNELEVEDLEMFANLEQLESLNLRGNQIGSVTNFLTRKTLKLSALQNYFPKLKFKDEAQFLSLCSALGRSKLSPKDKDFFAHYFMQCTDIQVDVSWEWEYLLKASQIAHIAFRRKLQQYLDEMIALYKGAETIDNQSIVYVTGKPSLTKTKIKKRLEELGLTYASKYNEAVSHVLIGMNSTDGNLLKDKSFIPLNVTQLEACYVQEQPRFLQEEEQNPTEESPIIDNVKSLLKSDDPSTILVALEMINSGGVPQGVVEDILLIQKTTADAKVRKRCRQLLEVNAPVHWLAIVRDRLSFKMLISDKPSETKVRKQLDKLAKYTSLEITMRFATLLFQRYAYGLRFALLNKQQPALRLEALQLLYKDKHLAYARGINYKNWRGYSDADVIMYGSNGINIPLPVMALELGTIHSLDLSNCKYKNVKKGITKFIDLRKLDLSYNYISKIPQYLSKLKDLEEIDLSYNSFSEFPMVLATFPQLKKVWIRYNQYNGERKALKVPKVFSDLLPDCKVMV